MCVAREPIEERRLGEAGQQALRLVLPMDLDQLLAQGRPGPTAVASWPEIRADPLPSALDRAGQDQLAVLGPFADVDGAIGRRSIEARLHARGARAVADQGR